MTTRISLEADDNCAFGRGGVITPGRRRGMEEKMHTLLPGYDQDAHFVPTIVMRRGRVGVAQRLFQD